MRLIKLITTTVIVSLFSIANAQTTASERNNPYEYAAMCAALMIQRSEAAGENTEAGKTYSNVGRYYLERLKFGLQKNQISDNKATSIFESTMDYVLSKQNEDHARGVTFDCLEKYKTSN